MLLRRGTLLAVLVPVLAAPGVAQARGVISYDPATATATYRTATFDVSEVRATRMSVSNVWSLRFDDSVLGLKAGTGCTVAAGSFTGSCPAQPFDKVDAALGWGDDLFHLNSSSAT